LRFAEDGHFEYPAELVHVLRLLMILM
jgi:hypothetical protein